MQERMIMFFTGSYHLREHMRKAKGGQGGSRAQNVHVTQVVGDVVHINLEEELHLCKHFLVDSKVKHGHIEFLFLLRTLCIQNFCLKS